MKHHFSVQKNSNNNERAFNWFFLIPYNSNPGFPSKRAKNFSKKSSYFALHLKQRMSSCLHLKWYFLFVNSYKPDSKFNAIVQLTNTVG
jgi:hypothetical protein